LSIHTMCGFGAYGLARTFYTAEYFKKGHRKMK
jgi:hypothetical protein